MMEPGGARVLVFKPHLTGRLRVAEFGVAVRVLLVGPYDRPHILPGDVQSCTHGSGAKSDAAPGPVCREGRGAGIGMR